MARSVILSYHDTLLRSEDVESLDGDNWINDNIFSFLFEYFEYEKYLNFSKELLFINPSIVQLLKFEKEPKPFIEKWDLEERKLIFLPINDNNILTHAGGTHWSLLVYDTRDFMCRHLDSFNQHNELTAKRVHQNLLLPIFELYKQHFVFIREPSEQQSNSSDCGIYVICYLEKIIKEWIRDKDIKIKEQERNVESIESMEKSQWEEQILSEKERKEKEKIVPEMIKEKRNELNNLIWFLVKRRV